MSPLLQIDRKCMTSLWIPGSLGATGFPDGVARFKSRKNIIFRITREARVNVLCLEFNCQFRFLYFISCSNINIFLLATIVLWDVIN